MEAPLVTSDSKSLYSHIYCSKCCHALKLLHIWKLYNIICIFSMWGLKINEFHSPKIICRTQKDTWEDLRMLVWGLGCGWRRRKHRECFLQLQITILSFNSQYQTRNKDFHTANTRNPPFHCQQLKSKNHQTVSERLIDEESHHQLFIFLDLIQ